MTTKEKLSDIGGLQAAIIEMTKLVEAFFNDNAGQPGTKTSSWGPFGSRGVAQLDIKICTNAVTEKFEFYLNALAAHPTQDNDGVSGED